MMRICYVSSMLLLFSWNCTAAVLVQGNNMNAPFGFNSDISAFGCDPLSGAIYVGLAQNSTNDIGEFAVSYAIRPSFNANFDFQPLATDPMSSFTGGIVNNRPIALLAVSAATNTEPLAILVRKDALTNLAAVSNRVITTVESAMDMITLQQSNVVTESTNINDANGVATSGIIALTANGDFGFAAVPTQNMPFGEAESGIALVQITRNVGELELTPLNNSPINSSFDNAAALLNKESIAINGGTNPVTFLGNEDTNKVALYFDAILNRLYIGTRIETGVVSGDIAKAVVIGDVTNNNTLQFNAIVPNSALDSMNRIIAALTNTTMAIPVSIKQIAVLHASTGPDYLIVNGGQGDTDTIGNKIRALPLVNDPLNTVTNGTLADKTSPLDPIRHVFTVPATTSTGLILDSDPAAVVGAGDLPIQASNNISSIMVAGDTVFVSSAVPNDTLNNSGIFYSRALFDVTGKIARWTPWARIVPSNLFPGLNPAQTTGLITNFCVDPRTGLIWFVDGNRNVGLTSWSTGNGNQGLITALNRALPTGVFSALDLNQSTRGFTDASTAGYRYALFGGSNKVTFALISRSNDVTNPNAPQTLITDFTLPQHILMTSLPPDAGCVNVLEYARQTSEEGNQNFFFAGTDMGLFVFSQPNGDGFSVNDLMTLDQPPFTTSQWTKVSTINGSITQLKTSGKKLYILAQTSTPTNPLQSTVYSIPFTSNIQTMFANPTIIAQTGTGVFADVQHFFDMTLLATGPTTDPTSHEQLVLATNQGLFFSSNPNGVQTATDQTTANWQVLEGTEKILFNGIGQDTTQPQFTVWPFAMADLNGRGTFTRSNVFQLTSSSDATSPFIGFVPLSFNAQNTILFPTFDHISGFWSDGARRFFVTQPVNCSSGAMNLNTLPFNTQEWNASNFLSLQFGSLATFNQFYWTQAIGSSGLLLAGTNTGVVGLA